MRAKSKDINLLFAYQFEAKQKGKSLKIFFLLLIIEVTLFAVISSIYLTKIASIKSEIRRLEVLTEQKQRTTTLVKSSAEQKKLLEMKQRFIDLKVNEHKKILKILEELEKITPQDVVFESLSFSENKFMCKVKSSSVQSLFQFILNMKKDSMFSDVSFTTVREENESKTISITTKISLGSE